MTEEPGHPTLTSVRISSGGHPVKVVAEDRPDIRVKGDAEVSDDGHAVTIAAAGPLTVRIPEGLDVLVGSGSGRIEVTGAAGDVSVLTDSGRIDIDDAASVDARTNSARVVVGRSGGECRVRSESGRVEVGACGSADVATDSGRIVLKHVDGPVKAHCVSGRIEVEMDSAHDIDAETVSGRVTVSLPPGVEAWHADEPHDSSDQPDDCDCVVNVRSVSGRVRVSSR